MTIVEAAEKLELDPEEALRTVEEKVGQLADPDHFENLEDALDYIRMGRLQKVLWGKSKRLRAEDAQQALGLIERRAALRKERKGPGTLTESVQNMLHANNIEMTDSEEQDDE